MKLIRCTVQPSQVDEIVDALKPTCVLDLTVTGGGRWHPDQQARQYVCRGVEYQAGLIPEAIIDITVPNDAVEEIVGVVLDRCRSGVNGDDGRINVMSVDESYTIRSRQRRIG